MANDIPNLETQPRERLGTRYSRRLRDEGRVPVVVYGHGQDVVHLSIDGKSFSDLMEHETHLVNLQIDGRGESCLIKDVQWDYLSKDIIHVDLARVDLSEEVEVEIELVLKGDPAGLEEEGTLLDHPIAMVAIACRADSIPDHVEHDISGLGVGDALTVGEVSFPEGVKCLMEDDTVICSIQYARVEEEPEEEAAEAAEGEPEVIGKEDKDEEEGEAEETE